MRAMTALPFFDNETGMRALDAACESPSSSASARTAVQLGKLSLATRKSYLFNALDLLWIVWIVLDLGHVMRCCLQELSTDVRFPERRNETALCAVAGHGSVRALIALLKTAAQITPWQIQTG
jgi:hypothetical protein